MKGKSDLVVTLVYVVCVIGAMMVLLVGQKPVPVGGGLGFIISGAGAMFLLANRIWGDGA